MEKFVIATTAEGCIFGNYFTEVMSRLIAEERLKEVRKADPNAKLLKVVIEEGGEEFNADKESSC